MKHELTSLDLYYLVKEFQQLVGSKVEKIFQSKVNKRLLQIRLYIKDKGNYLLTFNLPKLVYLTKTKHEFPSIPPHFCTVLRKHLNGTIITKITQIHFDRILRIDFSTKFGNFALISELFSTGNMILCTINEDKTLKILEPLERQLWGKRLLKHHEIYKPAESLILSPNLDLSEFSDILKKSDKQNIVKTLAMDLNLGGQNSEYLCLISKIDKTKKKLEPEERLILYKNFLTLFNNTLNKSTNKDLDYLKIWIYPDGTISPINLNKEKSTFILGFNKAISQKFDEQSVKLSPSNIKSKKHKNKFEAIINSQKKSLKSYKQKYDSYQSKGEFIYSHYTELKQILDSLKKARETMSWSEIKSKLKDHPIIKSINEKTGEIEVELN